MPKRSRNMLPLSEKICVYREDRVYIGLSTVEVSGIPWGSWNISPTDKWALLCVCVCVYSFKKDFIYLFLERQEEREQGRERKANVWRSTSCLSHIPNWVSGLQPRHVP